jgi:hypothetical protein
MVGSTVRSTAEFRTVDQVLTDPTTVKFKLRTPAGVESVKLYLTDAEVVKIATGRYRCDFPVTARGDYHARWTGEGSLVVAGEEVVPVGRSEFTTP